MSLSGTEAEIVKVVTKLKGASKSEINKWTGLSLDYIGYICRFLTKKGYLAFSNGRYHLAGAPVETLSQEPALSQEPKIDKSFIREIAEAVAQRIGVSRGGGADETPETVKIKTDFELPIRDESLELESNINKVGAKSETEKFNINKLIESLIKVRKGGR